MTDPIRVLVTGGAGFIGSALVRYLVGQCHVTVLNLDKLTYAGNLSSLRDVERCAGFQHRTVDICDPEAVAAAFAEFEPQYVMHLAAESHVDRSIDGPADFIRTNVLGTYTMLDAAHRFWQTLDPNRRPTFRFHHISTDEVFGSLGATGCFTESTPYAPRSPYSASKAAADHLVMAWHHTYGLPVVLTNCSNNYGPYHFPEKLIPLVILNALDRKPLPIYGRGDNVRDWLYVDDHVQALWLVVRKGIAGETYNVGGNCERTNLQVVQTICDLLDELRPHLDGSYANLITFVSDRPGHDQRYAIDARKICAKLGWTPSETFESGLRKTVAWYLANPWWWGPIRDGKYAGERLGTVRR